MSTRFTGRYHWSNCAYPATFLRINCIASVPWLAVLLFYSKITLYLAITLTISLIFIELYKKMTISAFIRSLFFWAGGKVVATTHIIKELSNK